MCAGGGKGDYVAQALKEFPVSLKRQMREQILIIQCEMECNRGLTMGIGVGTRT